MKTHLKRTFGELSFTFEETQTILCQIEGCLNSRPLCPLTNNINSLDTLTPANFLTGEQFLSIQEMDFKLTKSGLLTRWELVKKMYQDVCSRYIREYLPRLLLRPKWLKRQDNLVVGQLVLVQDDGTSSNFWPVGRITVVHPGSDGVVRVATVRMNGWEKNGRLPNCTRCLPTLN